MTHVSPTTTVELDQPSQLAWQRGEWIVERCGMILLAAIVLAAGLGILGPGLLSETKRTSADGRLAMQYPHMQRYQADTQLVLRLAPASDSGLVRLGIGRGFCDQVNIESITPQPALVEMEKDRLIYSFRGSAAAGPVTIRYQNEHYGTIRLAVDLNDSSRLDLSYFVLP